MVAVNSRRLIGSPRRRVEIFAATPAADQFSQYCVSGSILADRGKPEIILTHPSQLTQ
jgi:hypothetical protein